MHKRIKVRDIVKLKGGTAHVARLCGVTPASVSQWSTAGSIPAKHARTLAHEWSLDADLLHNPWGWRAPLMTEEELHTELALERHIIDPYEPVEFEPLPEGYEEEEEICVEPPKKKTGWSEEELDAFLRGEV
jgi:transcriptional regulator with XRE-family HTH domain